MNKTKVPRSAINKNSGNFYNRFSIFYPLVDLFLKPQKSKLFQEINRQVPGTLLDVGVGHGAHLQFYKSHKITGIDTSVNMLERARKNKIKDLELLEMNGEDLSFQDHSFDYIILSHVIAVVHDPEKLLEESFRVLKPKGKIYILNHFTPKNKLRYLDYTFQIFSKYFHFKSFFPISALSTLKKFKLENEINLDKFSYFKLLIFTKP